MLHRRRMAHGTVSPVIRSEIRWPKTAPWRRSGPPANLRTVMKSTPPKYPYPKKVYPPLNRCAYCSACEPTSAGPLTTEHIIPLGFGGELILSNASCAAHQTATSKVEAFVLRKYLCALRSHLGLPSRKPLQRPDGYQLKLRSGLRSWKQKVTLARHPGVVRFVMFEPAGKVVGRVREPATFSFRLINAEIWFRSVWPVSARIRSRMESRSTR